MPTKEDTKLNDMWTAGFWYRYSCRKMELDGDEWTLTYN